MELIRRSAWHLSGRLNYVWGKNNFSCPRLKNLQDLLFPNNCSPWFLLFKLWLFFFVQTFTEELSHVTYLCVRAINLGVLRDWNVQLQPEVLAKTKLIPVTSSCTQYTMEDNMVPVFTLHKKIIKLTVPHSFSSDTVNFAIQTLAQQLKHLVKQCIWYVWKISGQNFK